MQEKEVIMMLDYRYDEGARPRKEKICPCIMSRNIGGMLESIPIGAPLVVERWKKSELNKQQNKDI